MERQQVSNDNIEFKVSKVIQIEIPEGREKYKVSTRESHLSYFHMKEIIEIIGFFLVLKLVSNKKAIERSSGKVLFLEPQEER